MNQEDRSIFNKVAVLGSLWCLSVVWLVMLIAAGGITQAVFRKVDVDLNVPLAGAFAVSCTIAELCWRLGPLLNNVWVKAYSILIGSVSAIGAILFLIAFCCSWSYEKLQLHDKYFATFIGVIAVLALSLMLLAVFGLSVILLLSIIDQLIGLAHPDEKKQK